MAKDTISVRIDREHYDKLAAIRDETGVPILEQLRRILQEYLEKRER